MALRKFSGWILVILFLFICLFLLQKVIKVNAQDPVANWINPQSITLKQITPQSGPQNEPYFFENLDCSLIDYRQAATSNMKTGCFTNTDYGMVDTDSYTVIFNGTDEGQSLTPYSDRDIIVPWPNATALLNLSNSSSEGAYLSMYKNPLGTMGDKRNLLTQITGKQISAFPEVLFTDTAGKRLIVNPKSIAFSSDGSWMVAETTYGSFVRINVATNSVLAFAPSFTRLGFSGLLDSQVAISGSGRYVAISNNNSRTFKIYDLNTCSSSVMETKSNFCASYDYGPLIKEKINGLSSIKHVRFSNSEILSFTANSSLQDKSGVYLISPNQISNYLEYLAMGDSYTSGEGAFDYLSGTDSSVNHCHLSAKSYPLLIKRDLFGNNNAYSVACSGAHINDVSNEDGRYVGQVANVPSYDNMSAYSPELLNAVKTNFLPGYIAQNMFAAEYQPRIITVSIGGNDVGFGDILETCALPKVTLHQSSNVCFNTYEDRVEILNLIDETSNKWKGSFEQLKNQAPRSTIYAIGYPIMISGQGSCGLNVHLNKSEIEFINEVVVYINNTMSSAASRSGIEYVNVENAFSGSKLCEGNSTDIAMNGLTAGKDGGILGLKVYGSESYHPNARGHELLEQAILEQTSNFKSALAKNSSSNKSKILSAPKSGREIHRKTPAKITSKVIKKGSKISIKVKGTKSGTKPKTSYQIKLGGPLGAVIETVISDQNGDIEGSATIPPESNSGSTSIDVIGPSQGNDKTDVYQPIYISDQDNDIDGDGIANNIDSCPGAVNSLIDQDKDGIDDACDSIISNGPTNSSSNTDASKPSETSNSTSTGSVKPNINSTDNTLISEQLNPQQPIPYSTLNIPKVTVSSIASSSNIKLTNPAPSNIRSGNTKVLNTGTAAPSSNKPQDAIKLKKYQNLPPQNIEWWQILMIVVIVWYFTYRTILERGKKYHIHKQHLVMNKKPSA